MKVCSLEIEILKEFYNSDIQRIKILFYGGKNSQSYFYLYAAVEKSKRIEPSTFGL